jgi:uncharacterized protein
MHDLTPWNALLGGALIGIAASWLLLTHGRVAGISDMLAGAVVPARGDVGWRLWFIAGLLVAGVVARALAPDSLGSSPRSLPLLVLAGLLVGAGTRLGNGCTSGHGVCGVSRLAPRSIVATATFVAVGAGMGVLLHRLGVGS